MADPKNLYVSDLLANDSTIKVVLFWISLVILIGLSSLSILFFMDGLATELVAMGISAMLVLFALELNRRNNTQLAGTIIAVALTTMITVLATIGQGIYDIAVMGYPAVLIVATLILKRNTTIYLTIFLIACIGWLIFGDTYGIYQPQFPDQSYTRQFYVASIIVIMTALVVQFLSQIVRNSAMATSHELEERKKVEQALREAEELYRNMVEETSVITYRDSAEKEGATIYISPQIEHILGYPQDAWKESPKLWLSLTHPEDLPDLLLKIESYLETGERAISEYRMQAKDGRWVWFQ